MRKRKLNNVERRSTQKTREKVISMIDEGKSSVEISKALNVRKMSVAGVMAWRKHPKAFKNVGRKTV